MTHCSIWTKGHNYVIDLIDILQDPLGLAWPLVKTPVHNTAGKLVNNNRSIIYLYLLDMTFLIESNYLHLEFPYLNNN